MSDGCRDWNPHQNRDLCKHGKVRPWLQRGLCPECEATCECADMLAAGAYGRFWCPAHHDFTEPPKYVVDALRKVQDKLLRTANELYALKQSIAGVDVPRADQPKGGA
jgi:hypothetical protein